MSLLAANDYVEDPGWGTVETVFYYVLTGVFILFLVTFFLYMIVLVFRAFRWFFYGPYELLVVDEALLEQERSRYVLGPEGPTDHTDQNVAEVVGWKLASEADLRELPPAQLQQKLDQANMFSEEIAELLELIPTYERASEPENQRRHQEMVRLLTELREQPDAVRRKARAAQADNIILRSREAVQSVEDLSED